MGDQLPLVYIDDANWADIDIATNNFKVNTILSTTYGPVSVQLNTQGKQERLDDITIELCLC